MRDQPTVRITKKSRMVEAIVETIQDLVLNDEDMSPSIARVANIIVDDSLTADANASVRTILMDEITNEVTRYWPEACKTSATNMGDMAHHMVSTHWYKKRKLPGNEAEARRYLAMFGNGRSHKTAGVRFLDKNTQDCKEDLMYRLVAQQRAHTTDAIGDSTRAFIEKGGKTGVLEEATVKKLTHDS